MPMNWTSILLIKYISNVRNRVLLSLEKIYFSFKSNNNTCSRVKLVIEKVKNNFCLSNQSHFSFQQILSQLQFLMKKSVADKRVKPCIVLNSEFWISKSSLFALNFYWLIVFSVKAGFCIFPTISHEFFGKFRLFSKFTKNPKTSHTWKTI